MNILYPKESIYQSLEKSLSIIHSQSKEYNEELIEVENALHSSLQDLIYIDFSQAILNYESRGNKPFPVKLWYKWKDYEPLDFIKILSATHTIHFDSILEEILYVDNNTRLNSGLALQILFRNNPYDFLVKNKLSIEDFHNKLMLIFVKNFKQENNVALITDEQLKNMHIRLRQWWSVQIGNPNINSIAQHYWEDIPNDVFNYAIKTFIEQQNFEKGQFIPVLERYLKQNQKDYILESLIKQFLDKKLEAPIEFKQKLVRAKIEHDVRVSKLKTNK